MLPCSLSTSSPSYCPGSFQHAKMESRTLDLVSMYVLSQRASCPAFPTHSSFFELQLDYCYRTDHRVVQKGLCGPEPGEGRVLEIGKVHMLRYWDPVTRRHDAFLPGPLVFTACYILLIRRAFFINLAFTILFECYNLLELQNSVKPFRRNVHLRSQLCHRTEFLLASGNRMYMREEGGAEESKLGK